MNVQPKSQIFLLKKGKQDSVFILKTAVKEKRNGKIIKKIALSILELHMTKTMNWKWYKATLENSNYYVHEENEMESKCNCLGEVVRLHTWTTNSINKSSFA